MKRNARTIGSQFSQRSMSGERLRFFSIGGFLLVMLGGVCTFPLTLSAQNATGSQQKTFLERIRPPFLKARDNAEDNASSPNNTEVPSGFISPQGDAPGDSNVMPSTLSEDWTPIGTSYTTPSSSIPQTVGTVPRTRPSASYNPSTRSGVTPGRQSAISSSATNATPQNSVNSVNSVNIVNGVNYGVATTTENQAGYPALFPVDQSEFHLPFENFLSLVPADQLREIRLYVSRNHGATWSKYQTLSREQIQSMQNKNFAVRSNSNGEIWFSLRVVNTQGVETPRESATPTWRVAVNAPGNNSQANIARNTGNNSTESVQNSGGIVRPQWAPTQSGNVAENLPGSGTAPENTNRTTQNPNLVVYSVKDRGTNSIPDVSLPVYKIPNSKPLETFTAFAGKGATEEKKHSVSKPEESSTADFGSLETSLNLDSIDLNAESTENSEDMLLMMGDTSTGEDGLNNRIRYMNQPSLSIDYDVSKVGSSGVGRVELWGTLDDGQTWSYMAEDRNQNNSINLNLKSDGKYGFQVLVFNGAGVGMERPQAGSAPQMEVVLDRINPRVQLYTIQLQAEFGDLEITWGADDLNFGSNPVMLSWSSSTEGPWRAMTSVPLENSGRFVWRIPEGIPGKVYIRIDTCDLAKNSTTLVTGPVVTDIMRPTGVIRDAKPAR